MRSASRPLRMTYDAFLSYSTRGDYWASRRVESFVEGFHATVRRAGATVRSLRVCRDGSDFRQVLKLADEDAIWARIRTSISASKRLLVMCSPESAASKWVDRELRWAIEQKLPIWLLMMAGDDPGRRPAGIVPPAAIEANLHTDQIWYDLRRWRRTKSDRVRDPEDELVRLALDLLDRPPDGDDIAAVWQRQTLRDRRRVLNVGLALAGFAVAGGTLAGWQFSVARTRADQAKQAADEAEQAARDARSASLVRIVDALATSSPLQSALMLAELDPDHVPLDALGVGYRLMSQELPSRRLRGHLSSIIAGTLSSDGRIWSIDDRGGVFAGDRDSYRQVTSPGIDRIQHVALSHGEPVLTYDDRIARADARCAIVGPSHVVPDDSGDRAIAIDHTGHLWWCDFTGGAPRQISEPVTVVATARHPSDPTAWLVATSDGRLWRIDRDGGAHAYGSAFALDGGVTGLETAPGGFVLFGRHGLVLGSISGNALHVHTLTTTSAVELARVAPTGDRVAVADAGAVVTIYRLTGEVETRLEHRIAYFRIDPDANNRTEEDTLPVTDLAWAPGDQRLATLQPGFGVRVWNTIPEYLAEPRVLRGHAGAQAIIWGSDGKAIATLGNDGEIHEWVDTPPEQVQLVARVTTAAVVDSRIAVGTSRGDIVLVDKENFSRTPTVLSPDRSCVSAQPPMATRWIHADGAGGLWSASRNGALTLWERDHDTYRVLRTDCTKGIGFAYIDSLDAVAVVDVDLRVQLADRGGVRSFDDTGRAGPLVEDLVASAGPWLVAGTQHGDILRWDTRQPRGATVVRRSHDHVTCVDVDATGSVLSGGEDGLATWTTFRGSSADPSWAGDNGWIESCVLSGTRAVIGTDRGHMRSLDVSRSGQSTPFANRLDVAHTGPVEHVVIAASGQAISGGAADGYVRVWDVASHHELGQVWLESPIIALLQDGPRVVAVSEAGLVRALPLNIIGVQHALRSRTAAELTPSERTALLSEDPVSAYVNYAMREAARGREPLPADMRFETPF